MTKYIVLERWDESYENPIALKKSDRVTIDLSVKDSDPEWINWVWCIAENGMHGWVPTQILKIQDTLSDKTQIATASEDYSAYELSVSEGDIVIGSKILNGWLWCRKENSDKEGWVPLRNVKISDILS
ncbi:MAG: SH3 domain-containing protein [Dysgonomonas sp.]|uniref:SH3 domain-containing protein n=1 Tax=Dysgonomonas sp. TaxID=1891233 RepID=UPI0039E70EB9